MKSTIFYIEKAVDINAEYFDPLFVHFGSVSSVGEFSKSELINCKTEFPGSKASQTETHVCIYQLFNCDDFCVFEFPGEEIVLFELTNLKTDF